MTGASSVWWPRPKSRKGRLPAPGGRKGGWPANKGRRQEDTGIADTERVNAEYLLELVPRSAQGKAGPAAPHSGCLWGGVQAPDEPAGIAPLTTT